MITITRNGRPVALLVREGRFWYAKRPDGTYTGLVFKRPDVGVVYYLRKRSHGDHNRKPEK